jgi:glyoxylase-like metal-dependent hydrolase (beta-lactamase superfamily II)
MAPNGSLVLLLAVLLTGCSASRVSLPAPLQAEAIAPDVWLQRGTFIAGQQPDGNSVLLRGRDGLVVFDTGRHAMHVQQLIDAAHAMRVPVAAIINSHWHLDHVSGNGALRAAYPHAQVLASDAIEQAMTGFLAEYRTQLQQQIAQAPSDSREVAGWREEIARIDQGPRLFPTQVVTADAERDIAGRAMHVGLVRNAVSGGDVWILDKASGVLASGDLVTLPVPLFDTACPEGWRDSLHQLDVQSFNVLVPGHGLPMTHTQVHTYRVAFDHLLACTAGKATDAQCHRGWIDDAGALIPPGDQRLADTLLDYYIPQVLRAPDSRRRRYCAAAPD